MAQRSRFTPLLALAGLGGVGLLLWAASSPPVAQPAPEPVPKPDPGPPAAPPPPVDEPAPSPPDTGPRSNAYQPPPGGSANERPVLIPREGGGLDLGTVNDAPPGPEWFPPTVQDAPPPPDAQEAYGLGWWNADAAARSLESLIEGVYGPPPASPLLAPWYALGKADRQAARPPRYAVAQQPPSGAAVADPGGPPPGSPSADPARECYVRGYLHRDAQDPQRRYYFTVATDRPTNIPELQRWWDLGYQHRAEGRPPLFPIEIIDSGGRPVPQVDSRKGGL